MPEQVHPMSVSRRSALFLLPAGLMATWSRPLLAAPVLQSAFFAIEARTGGRLGVAALDAEGQTLAAWRAEERFALCSTFKLLLAAAVLARVDEGRELLSRRVTYAAANLVSYSPVTEKRVGEGMTVGELCEATVTLSDNTAANLLLSTIGGPQGLTAFARRIGDQVTRLDRWETALNSAIPGDERDTTSPLAMATDIRALVNGDVLKPASRTQLRDWLFATRTGDARLRAGLPGWKVGDKTGTGDRNTVNDVGFALAPGAAADAPAISLAVYLTQSRLDVDASSAVIAEVAALVGTAATG